MFPGSVRPLNEAKVNNFNPSIIAEQESDVRVYEGVQTAAALVIDAPMAYLCGVNLGYNETEAVNYANPTSLDIGLQKNLVPKQQQDKSYVLMPFKYIFHREVYRVLAEMGGRVRGEASEMHRKNARDVRNAL